ncbi:MAG: hypothetical protein H0X41_07425 [Chitinophagaceae bacterium]|nr:hypothetical protein [Chitinophagaceae bacterium]
MQKKRILLIQLFSNGDCLYATAIARQIKKDFEGCHLTWAVSVSCKNIISNNPFVDDIIEVSSVAKNDERSFAKFVRSEKKSGRWDEVVVTHIMGKNQANYDGCIRSAIFRGYRYPLNVNIQPVLHLTDEEKEKARSFAETYCLSSYKNVILFEFAPLSGQSAITPQQSLNIAERLAGPEFAVILSSANRITHDEPSIIDGSILSIRETAALTHYCTFLIGCSSGITWLTTSDGANQLPMVQLLNPHTNWINPLSRDFERFDLDEKSLIELFEFDTDKVVQCVNKAVTGFSDARNKYHQQVPLHFTTTRNIVYNLLCHLHFSSILKHIRINREMFGDRLSFYKEVAMGFLIFPFRLTANFFRKKVFRR